MGTFSHTIAIASSPGGPYETVDALVDSGATYMLMPLTILQRLGVRPLRKQPFILANGARTEYDISIVWVRIGGEERPTVCIWGEASSKPLLGTYTLEGFLLGIDPVNKTLVPVTGYLV